MLSKASGLTDLDMKVVTMFTKQQEQEGSIELHESFGLSISII
jgi:hypothetical protein